MFRRWCWTLCAVLLATMMQVSVVAQEPRVFERLDDAAGALADQFGQSAKRAPGEVLSVDGQGQVYVAFNTAAVPMSGELLDLVERGDAITLPDGTVIGHQETPVGTLKVNRVQGEMLAICAVVTTVAGKQPAEGQVAYTKGIPTRAIAIVDFLDAQHQPKLLGHELASHLEHKLSDRPPFTLLERQQLDAALAEAKLTLSDLFDPAKAQALGKLLPSEGLVLGEVFQGAGSYVVNVRMIDLETGAFVATASASLTRSPEFDQKFSTPYQPGKSTGGIEVGGGASGGSTVILYAGEPSAQVRTAFAKAGLQIQEVSQLPSSLDPSQIRAIVIQDRTTVRQSSAQALPGYLQAGGGLVVVGGDVAEALAGTKRGYSSIRTDSISPWFGVSMLYRDDYRQALQKGSFPSGYSGPQQLWGSAAGVEKCMISERYLEQFAQAVITGRRDTDILGYTYSYGDGRVYWQSMIDGGPNYPQLAEFFAHAVRWTAHLKAATRTGQAMSGGGNTGGGGGGNGGGGGGGGGITLGDVIDILKDL